MSKEIGNSIKKKVLIVEDDTTLCSLIKSKLIHEGFDVLIANDGAEGLEVTLSDKPDIILLDILMPKMNGVEMLESLRKDSRGKDVPVVLLTNDTDPIHMREALKFDAVAYLTKSDWDLDTVISVVKTKIGL